MRRKTYFNEAAETWDQKYCTPKLTTFLAKFVFTFGLKPGEKVLDVGTGTGVLIPFLSKAVGPSGSITAIDYAENMVQRCRSKYSQLKNVAIKLQDVEELDLPSASFDAIICFGLFPHIENKVKALNNMYRVLKHGGILIIAHAISRAEIKDHHSTASSAVAYDVLPKEPEMRQLLHGTGFAEISINDDHGYYLCLSTKS